MFYRSVKFIPIPAQEQVVFMHVMPLSKVNNVKTRNEKLNKLPEKNNAKKVDKQPNEYQVKSPAPELKELELQQLSDSKPKVKPQEEKSRTELPTQPDGTKVDKIQEIKKQPIKQEKQTEKKTNKPKVKSQKEDVDELDLGNLEKSLIKNIKDLNKEKASQGDKDKSKNKTSGVGQDDKTSSSSNYDDNSAESVTAKVLLQKRIESNWSKPSSMRDYENIKVKVRLKIDMNQNVQEISGFEFLNENVPGNVKNAIKESIIRAIKLSDPFEMLDIEHYQYWHDNLLIFSYK